MKFASEVTLNRISIVIGFIGGMMMAIDLAGQNRTDKAEKTVRRIAGATLEMTRSLFQKTLAEPLKSKEALAGFLGVAIPGFIALLSYLLSLPFGESTVVHRIFYGFALILGVPVGLVIVLAIFVWIPLILFLVSALWAFCAVVWVIGSPLILGVYLRDRYAFKAAVPTAGALLVILAFLLQFGATFFR